MGRTASRIRNDFAVVPPMSNESNSPMPIRSAYWRAMIAPATGPDSMSRTGNSRAVSVETRPPPDSMTRSGAVNPRRASPSST